MNLSSSFPLRVSAIGAAAALSLGALTIAGPVSTSTPASAAETAAKSPCPYKGSHSLIKKNAGNITSDVKHAQCLLNLLGYNLKVDGIFGVGTENAVKDWQSKHKALKVDGVIGAKTWDSLHAGVK
ncbi:peptidoglycan-binding domain-containing protein [Rothia uropygioeca]|uniref:peptidoglycan-binding domain-containing protein n=1 Tax=Kocuria sp. 257 TaxID=2021970 RepID=UPI001010169D|nr:peptidoglycan-binding domain-containing protein [Kocuria sp. 257]